MWKMGTSRDFGPHESEPYWTSNPGQSNYVSDFLRVLSLREPWNLPNFLMGRLSSMLAWFNWPIIHRQTDERINMCYNPYYPQNVLNNADNVRFATY